MRHLFLERAPGRRSTIRRRIGWQGSRGVALKHLRLLLVAVLLLSVACTGGRESNGDSSEPTVKIALEAPITGEQASNGVDMLNGAELAADEANEAGGIMGRQVEVVAADDQADPEKGKEVAQQMVDEGVFAVVGPYNSSVGVENLQTYLDAGVVTIHLTSNAATNGQGFTIQPKDYQTAPIEAEAISGYFQAQKVAIVYDPQTYTAGIASQLRDALGKKGTDIVLYQKIDPKRANYTDLLERIKRLSPDLLYVQTYYPQGGLIAKELQRVKMSSTCLMGLANQDPAFVDVAGLQAAQDCWSSGVPSPDQFPGAQQYVTDYRAKFGAEPGTWGSFTYDSMKLLFDAVEQAGGWDSDKTNQALASTSGYQGITGSITIDPSTGNREDVPVVILRIDDDGSYVVDPGWADFVGFGS
jgi:branched-chain amino acid transport system substrate-binding protein